MELEKIGFGGGCHWCTEAVFASLVGVETVKQGWISSHEPEDSFSEAVLVHFDPQHISVEVLIDIHLRTHQSRKNHSMREKYRSAVYTFPANHGLAEELLIKLEEKREGQVVTKILPFVSFKSSPEKYQDYYGKNRDKPFCTTYIDPKLSSLMNSHKKYLKTESAES